MKKLYLKYPFIVTLVVSCIIYLLIMISIEASFVFFGLSRDLTPTISKYVTSFYPVIVEAFIGIAFLVRAKKYKKANSKVAYWVNLIVAMNFLILAWMSLEGAILLIS